MRLGGAIRIAIVGAWLGLFGWHVARRVAPGLGLSERADIGAILGQHLDQMLEYRVRVGADRRAAADAADAPPRAAAGRDIGECRIWFTRDEARFRIEHRVRIDDLRAVLGLAGRGLAGATALAEVDLIYDDRFRLAGVDGSLTLTGAMAIDATYTGVVDHRGLVVSYTLGDAPARTMIVPGIGREGANAEILVPVLPPNLAPGDRFAVPMIDAKRLMATGGADARSRGVLRVEAEDTVPTAAGPLSLLRVAMDADGQRQSTAWCDRKGTVYRIELATVPLVAELTSIRGGGVEWPPPRTPATPPTPAGPAAPVPAEGTPR